MAEYHSIPKINLRSFWGRREEKWRLFRGRFGDHFGDCADLDLGVVLDKHFDMSTQVNNICKSASLAMRNIGKIRNYLDQPTLSSKIDFSNSLLFGFSKKQLNKLQRIVLNAPARITTKTNISAHFSGITCL